ncbi:MAG: glucose 1-dehydrogenase [Polyangiaceae bacterium]|nr:glucose 1-dehydrogenase [Polyangiaceae bacterium]
MKSVLERFRLDGRVALVTGAGRGIGRATALALAEAGADVVVAARRGDTLDAVVAGIAERGRRGLAVPTDVTVGAELDRLLAQTLEAFGRLDVLVNNAGGAPPCIALAVPDEALEAAYHFNVTAAFHLSREAAPHLAKSPGGGAIVQTSSALSHLVDVGFVAYGAAKAALNHMTRLLAAEWAPKVRVNAVAAGATVTDALEAFVAVDELRQQMEARTPMARLAEPEDVAAAILFLASPAASWITGKILEVDGGTVASNWPFVIPGGL